MAVWERYEMGGASICERSVYAGGGQEQAELCGEVLVSLREKGAVTGKTKGQVCEQRTVRRQEVAIINRLKAESAGGIEHGKELNAR